MCNTGSRIVRGVIVVALFLAAVEPAIPAARASAVATETTDRTHLHDTFAKTHARLKGLETTVARLEQLARQPEPEALSHRERTELYHFGVWLENVARQLHDHFDNWNAEYEHFIETEQIRADLVDIFLKVNHDFSDQCEALRARFLHELDNFGFTHPDLQQRREDVRRSLTALP